MELGGHVLDAFNIDFCDFLDNITYATVIDLVGKYQLEMQQAFSYAPMARSMGPMLQEEAFHLGSGRKLLKEIGQKKVEIYKSLKPDRDDPDLLRGSATIVVKERQFDVLFIGDKQQIDHDRDVYPMRVINVDELKKGK